jgi:enoyl-CoA hydratase
VGRMNDLLVERNEHVVTLTLNRPERRNAISRSLLQTLVDTCEALQADSTLRIVVIRAMGTDFSVGMDLKDLENAKIFEAPLGERRRLLQLGPRMMAAVQTLPQTTICALQGHCLGGAGCLALACDLRLAGSDLRFGMPEVLRGMTMSWRSVPLMVEHFGPARTKELLLTGRSIDAHEALSWGLANRVIAGGVEALHGAAQEWAHELAAKVPPLAATMVKDTVNAVANFRTPLVHMDTEQYLAAQATEDYRESVTAFLEKRTPSFKGQ